ncbi:hypothetical protein DL93DRAFT_2161023 [Clavulina sp. PMI_390]|nr:hypothetical protein DL93DRAFT_2161023 [Clavulina sp. PMI_390]
MSSLSISSNCSSTITNLTLSSEGGCLHLDGILPLVALSSTNSIIPPVDEFLTGFCSNFTGMSTNGTCTTSTLTDLGNQLVGACGPDFVEAGMGETVVRSFTSWLVHFYDVFGEAMCTRDKGEGDDLCVVEELTTLQNSLGGNLTASNFFLAKVHAFTNTTLEKSLLCSTCAQGIERDAICGGSTPSTSMRGT